MKIYKHKVETGWALTGSDIDTMEVDGNIGKLVVLCSSNQINIIHTIHARLNGVWEALILIWHICQNIFTNSHSEIEIEYNLIVSKWWIYKKIDH